MIFQAIELSAAHRPELYSDETLLFVQDAVGLYERKYKLPQHQNGQVYLTSHRICYVDNANPRQKSTAVPLKLVERCEHYAGFLKSSPKITLYPKALGRPGVQSLSQITSELSLGRSPPRSSAASPYPRTESPLSNQVFSAGTPRAQSTTWVCPICSFSNALPLSFDATVANEQTPLPPCRTCGIKPPLALLLKAAISNASSRASQDSTRLAPNPLLTGTSSSGAKSLPVRTDTDARPSHVCPRCTFENHPSLQSCEMCGASLVSALQNHDYDSEMRAESPGRTIEEIRGLGDDKLDNIKISFRNGGDKAFYERLKGALVQKKWLSDHAPPIPQPHSPIVDGRSNPGSGAQTPEPKGVGIAGLERRGLERRRNNEAVISTAFEDLEALMASAQDIINLAESFADKSSNASASDIIQDAAVSMATTKDMLGSNASGSDTLYLSELSRELAEYLTNERVGVLRRAGGIMSLIDLWAEFNDLRNGVELINPSDFEKAARLWEKLGLPVRLRTFRNGLLVIQRHDQTDSKTITQILAWLQELHEPLPLGPGVTEPPYDVKTYGRGVTPREAATKFGWSVGVAVEELEIAEENGVLCREEGIEGLKFWENWIGRSQ